MKYFKSITLREKVLVITTAALLLLTAVYTTAIKPLYESYRQKHARLAKLESKKMILINKIKTGKETRFKIENALEKNRLLQKRVEEAKENIIDRNRLNSILSILENLTAAGDILLIGMSINTTGVKAPAPNMRRQVKRDIQNADSIEYDRNLITITLQSDYGSLSVFFRRLFESDLAMSLLKFTVSSDDSNRTHSLKTEIRLEMFTSAT